MSIGTVARQAGWKLAHLKLSLRLALCGQLLGASLVALAQTPVVVAGGLSGQQSVGESGAAQYRVALQVPAGVAGMQPRLALSYNSQGGNGLLGMGWNLEGLSAITRCPRTMGSDGARGGVNLDANDRYCLDGQRLLVVGGSYGAANSEYRTEREAFSKIVAVGTAGTAPQSFIVKTKAGLTMEYGATADARIEAQGKSEVRAWALNKMQDVKGNYLTISYTEDGTNGDYRPERIDYSGNQGGGLVPLQSVRFIYQSRTDSVPQYQSGSLIKITVRLSNIQTYAKVAAADTLINDYRLEYEYSPATLRSRLSKISQCNAANECLQPIVPGWQGPGSTQAAFDFSRSLPGATTANNAYIDASHKEIISGDFNGDGKTDLLHLHPNADPQYSWVALSYGTGSFAFFRNLPGASATTNSYLDASNKTILTGDFNGDGLTDLLHLQPNSADPQYSWVALAKGDGTFTFSRSLPGAAAVTNSYLDASNQDILTGDFNGDGRTDLLHLQASSDPQYSWVALSNGNGTFTFMRSLPGAAAATNSYLDANRAILTGDFNGDGLTDMLHLHPNADPQYSWVALSKGDGTFTFSRSLPGAAVATNSYLDVSNQEILTGDFNGDGKTDMLHLQANADPQYSWVALSKGDGTFTFSRSLPGAAAATNSYLDASNKEISTGDFNGDGLTDLLHLQANADTQYSWVALSKGDGTFTFSRSLPGAAAATNSYLDASNKTIIGGDFNGDGRPDLLHLQPSADNQYSWVALGQGVIPDYLSQISGGEGVTSLVYKPLTDSTVYTKASTLSAYPRMDMQAPIYVVSSASTSNGVGGNNTIEYQYGELKLELGTGRGTLGYRWTKNKELASNIERYTEYRQSYPYTGMPIKSETRLAGSGNGGVLKRVSYALDCQSPQTAASCVLMAGNRYFTYVSQSVEESWDLGGTAMPVITSSYTYAQNPQYGDPTQIVVGNSVAGTKTTVNTYSNDESNWVLGRLSRSQVTSSNDATPPGTSVQGGANDTYLFIQQVASNAMNYSVKRAAISDGWDQVKPLKAVISVASGVYIGSNSTQTPSFETEDGFPAGSSITLTNYGSILGRGGDGASAAGESGKPGGLAFRVSYPITVRNYGVIGGGGGGGGLGRVPAYLVYSTGNCVSVGDAEYCETIEQHRQAASGGANGGAGYPAGLGATYSRGENNAYCNGAYSPQQAGATGTYTGAGMAGVGAYGQCGGISIRGGGGGYGGGLGSPGAAGGSGTVSPMDSFYRVIFNETPGGAAGGAVEGNSFITWVQTGVRQGSIVGGADVIGQDPTGESGQNYVFMPVITANTQNYNLRAAAVAAGWDQVKPLQATVTINSGVYVGSSSITTPAFETGSSFPNGSNITLVNNGSIVGRGGDGASAVNSPGQPGGPAVKVTYALTIRNYGVIGGGGGGGGRGASLAHNWPASGCGYDEIGSYQCSFIGYSSDSQGGGGGGGAGAILGAGGTATSGGSFCGGGWYYASSGSAGTNTAGGARGAGSSNGCVTGSPGGAGGGLGQPGSAGASTYSINYVPSLYGGNSTISAATAGGAAGAATTAGSNAYINWNVTGTRLGALQ